MLACNRGRLRTSCRRRHQQSQSATPGSSRSVGPSFRNGTVVLAQWTDRSGGSEIASSRRRLGDRRRRAHRLSRPHRCAQHLRNSRWPGAPAAARWRWWTRCCRSCPNNGCGPAAPFARGPEDRPTTTVGSKAADRFDPRTAASNSARGAGLHHRCHASRRAASSPDKAP